MSLIKKGVKAIGKVVKGVVKFVKKNWKVIAVAALGVFTMGIATVGFAGFSGAMAAAGGGFGGFMSAVGSTMYAGITALGGSLGIGTGAKGTAAFYGNVEGVGLFGGHAAAALGSESAKAGIAAQEAAKASILEPVTATATKIGGPLAGVQAPSGTGATTSSVGSVPNKIAMNYKPPPTSTPAPATSTGGGIASGMTRAALINTAGQMLSGYAAGKMQEEDDPLGFWGVDLSGKGEDKFGFTNQYGRQVGEVGQEEVQRPAQAPPKEPQVVNRQQYQAAMPPVPGLMNAPWAPQGI